jgi:hypothetical protein
LPKPTKGGLREARERYTPLPGIKLLERGRKYKEII